MAERKPWSKVRIGHNKIYSVGIELNEKDEQSKAVDRVNQEAIDEWPKGVSEESLKEENPTLVYCNFFDCVWNKKISGLKKFMTASKNELSKPWNFPDDAYDGVCSRGVIAIRKSKITMGPSGSGSYKKDVPECFTMGKDGRATDHIDFTKLMPQGGNIPDPVGGGYV